MYKIPEHEALEQFDEWLDESHEMLIVNGHRLRPSVCLKNADFTAYRGDFLDYCEISQIDID
jgi:hypothetical protein